MKQGNNNSNPSNCSCVSLQLHLLSLPKSRFSDSLRTLVISIIAFIALVASFSLKNLPTSEKMFVPLTLGIGLCVFLISTIKILILRDIRKALCSFLTTLSQLIFNLRNLNIVTYADYKDEANNEKEEDDKKPDDSTHEAVDLGLSVKWATCNIGASSPEEYGDYFAWGETEEKTNYDWSTYKWCKGSYDSLTKYCTNKYGDNKTTLDPEDDVAHVKWGGDWRMPTLTEIKELCEKCSWQWTEINGVSGEKVTGPNGNSIFLPFAGYRQGTEVKYCGTSGQYPSGILDITGYSNLSVYTLHIDYGGEWSFASRRLGFTIRPVAE